MSNALNVPIRMFVAGNVSSLHPLLEESSSKSVHLQGEGGVEKTGGKKGKRMRKKGIAVGVGPKWGRQQWAGPRASRQVGQFFDSYAQRRSILIEVDPEGTSLKPVRQLHL